VRGLGKSEDVSITEKIESLLGILEWQPWRSEIFEKLGSLYYQQGDFEKANSYFRLSAEKDALSLEGRQLYCDALLKAESSNEAIQCWQLVAENWGQAQAWEHIFEIVNQTGDVAMIQAYLEKWAEHDASNPRVWHEMALISMIDNPFQSLQAVKRVQALDFRFGMENAELYTFINRVIQETDPAVQAVLCGRELARINHWLYASAAFQYAIELEPEYAEAWAFLSEAQYNLGIDGLNALRTAIQLDPQSEIALSMLALYYRRNAQPELAFAYLQKVAQLYPDRGIWQVELASALTEMGDINGALAYLQKAVQLEPQNLAYWQKIIIFCLDHEMEVRNIALPAARNSLLIAPDSAENLDLMARVFVYLGDHIEGQRFLHKAYQMDPESPEVNLHLAEVYILQEQYDSACSHLLKVVSLTSENDFTGMIARRLLEQISSAGRENGETQ